MLIFSTLKDDLSMFSPSFNHELESTSQVLFFKDSSAYLIVNKKILKKIESEIINRHVISGEEKFSKYPTLSYSSKIIEIHLKVNKCDLQISSIDKFIVAIEIFIPEEIKDDTLKIVTVFPRFPGCESADEFIDQTINCSQEKMLSFIYKNSIGLSQGVRGFNVVGFIVEKNGRLSNIRLIRDGGNGELALRIIRLMNEMENSWIPGYDQYGRVTTVAMKVPVSI